MRQSADTGFFGFEGLDDFFNSLLGTKTWVINSIIAVIGYVTTLIAGYMWDDPNAVYLLWSIMAVDYATGIYKSKKNNRFVSYKLWRMPLYFIATTVVLAFSWHMSRMYSVFYPLPSIAMCGFYSVYFVSVLENLGEAELLPEPIVKLLKSKFGLKKLFNSEKDEH